jgi:hypothetical protein
MTFRFKSHPFTPAHHHRRQSKYGSQGAYQLSIYFLRTTKHWKIPRDPRGGGHQPKLFGGKNMKRRREKGRKCKRKRKKGERKRKNGEIRIKEKEKGIEGKGK